MPLFDANTLANYRALQEENMIHECDLIAFGKSRTATGSTNLAPFITATVKCRLAIEDAALVIQAEQQTRQADYMLYLPIDADLTHVERITVRGASKGVPWIIELDDVKPIEPRSYSASKKVRASLATDTLTPPPLVDHITITES